MTVTRRSSGVSLLLVVLVLTGAVSCEETRREVEGGEDQTSDLGGLRTSSAGLPVRSGEADTSVKGSEGNSKYSRTRGPSDETHPEKDLTESRKKKDGMQKIYMLFMIWKSLVSTKLKMLDPLFKVKMVFISAIGLIVQILNLLLKYKSSKKVSKSQMDGGGGMSGMTGTGWEDRLGAAIPLAPNYITRYTIEQ